MTSRRDFLRSCLRLGAVGAGANLTKMGLISGLAANTSGYKALVCIFMFGGNDGANTVVPMNSSEYADYAASRGPLALAQGSLIPISHNGVGYGLHPRLSGLQSLYNQGLAAIALNVGILVKPSTKADLKSKLVPSPARLFSHSDQTDQWYSANPLGRLPTGWSGRAIDLMTAANTGQIQSGISVTGNNLQLVGPISRPVSMGPGSTLGLDTLGDTQADSARDIAVPNILTFDTGVQLIGTASGITSSAFSQAKAISAAISAANLQTTFANTPIAQQLKQVAQIIAARQALGMNRQIFFCAFGSFDQHSNHLFSHDRLLGWFDQALTSFHAATIELGVTSQVTTFTESEFGRSLEPNTNAGTDHAWGGHHIVMGGAVQGGVYGTMPSLAIGSPDDIGTRGLIIPTISMDQYAATLASWFGVADSELPLVFPNLVNFPTQKLAFMG